MSKKEVPLMQLADYLPNGSYEYVADYLHQYKVHLTIAKSRSSILGDYRHKADTKNHRISVNGNLNKYAFLITLLHELAHLLTFEQFGRRVQAHGKEWKSIYSNMLAIFLQKKLFPADIEAELLKTLRAPGASTCSETGLQRVLYKYDDSKAGFTLVENVPEGHIFTTTDGRQFVKGIKRRTRHICKELTTGRSFLFSGVYEVKTEQGF
ncbi:MAG: SprT-like domain-containing protein [Niabella sp.]